MSRYIEFTTFPGHEYAYFAKGNPLYYGALPSRLVDTAQVRVDGEPIRFENDAVAENLLSSLRRMDNNYNCYMFAGLMHELDITGEDLPPEFIAPDWDTPVGPADLADKPVLLGSVEDNALYDIFHSKHMVSPAHHNGRPAYLHKLGSAGPICLSGLRAAMNMYDSPDAFTTAYR